ncbi:hypothetical protein [Oleiharenicola lentus]|uniref:hypothetical protein n=1 Tax=Oleiharenicola lentus TaxID=2508720 RepID=UPI003F67DE0F
MKSERDSIFRAKAAKPEHPLAWLAEPLAGEPSFVLKSWFGGRTIMLHGKHYLFLTTQGEPWQGVLVCTFHEHQPSLRAEFPSLAPHPVLGKWLYLSEDAETFERDARALVKLVKAGDPRLGISPAPKKKKKIRERIRPERKRDKR